MIDCEKITIAAINGPGVGYGASSIGLFDLVYAVPGAYFFAPFIKRGLCAEACSSFAFPNIMGRQRASHMLLTGDRATAPELAAAGLRNNSATWFGRGPCESYRDKKESTRLKKWDASLDKLQTNYEWPQENGNRTDVFWARIQSAEIGDVLALEARMEQTFSFTLRKYTFEELDRARHPHELIEAKENIHSLHYAQHGLGTGSCGHRRLSSIA
ncbi:galactose mutarotase-like domain-containing protein [Aspergillus recurvatus]